MGGRTSRPGWWQGATLYQIYVRSWRDTDGDGHGDLRGVTAGLDYLQWLGVDGIWLSPTMPSPDHDWGYDVSDYTSVHPGLGTLADLDDLVAEARARDMAVMLDLVPNHTSTAHPWFADAASGPDAAHRSYYLWADPAPGGGPPNNWRDAAGMPAWAYDSASGQYYLHSFLTSQADLNWREPAVHESFRQIVRFWFDRGIAGFRIDVAHGLYKDAGLRDDPPATGSGPLLGRSGLAQVYSANRPESHGVFRDWRAIADSYSPPRLLLGETWVASLDAMADFHGQGDELQLTFNFPFLFAEFTAPALAAVVARTLAALPTGESPVWAGSNHDVSRFPTRWCGGDEARARLALLILATLPGTLVLYYGDELALTDVIVPAHLRRDEMSRDLPADQARDRSRTPMPWDASASAGFTAPGVTPWLPLGASSARNVAGQRADPESTLSFCRELLALRRAESGGQVAAYRQLPAPPGVWAYQAGGLLVAANLTDDPVRWQGPIGDVLLTTDPALRITGTVTELPPWRGLAARLATPPGLAGHIPGPMPGDVDGRR